MENKKIKWLVYTVGVGLIPTFLRLLIWSVTKSGTTNALTASDFIAFGFVLHISNINEIALAIISFLLSFSVFHRIPKPQSRRTH